MLTKSSTPKSKETPETKGKRRTRAQIVAAEAEEKEKGKEEQPQQLEEDENNVIETAVRSKKNSGAKNSNETDTTTKRKTRKNSTAATVTTTTTTPAVILVDDDAVHTNTRPKRSCVTKKRYSLLEEAYEEPTKTRSAKSRASKAENGVASSEVQEIDVIEIVDLDNSKSTPKRLAPLFTRGQPKPSPDPQLVQARRNFLHSGVPEKLLLEQTRQKQYQQNCVDSFQLFPTLSHIKQLSTTETDEHTAQKSLSIKLKSSAHAELDLDGMKMKSHKFGLLLTNCNAKELTKAKTRAETVLCLKLIQCRCNNPLSSIPGKRLVAKAWKLRHERFPTFKCYNQLREKYRYFSALDAAQDVQQVSESLVVTRLSKHANNNNINNNNNNTINDNSNDEFSQPPAAAPNGELLFTEKYKPLLFEQILVNLTPVMQLREFLSNFCLKRSNANSDSDLDTDNDSNSNAANMPQNGNTVVLMGPCASGKTNAVFALANEFNFNVLEINAGMKRTGKRLLQELHEATQSHQIRKEGNSLNGRRKSRQECSAELDSARRCLILIEDADIAFEQIDAGFVDAIYTLASVSKRPVIIVASNPNCAHLQRLIQQNTIKFALPHAVSISRYMSLLSLIENCPVSIDDIVSLYLYNGMDVRRTLLELQLFVQSGGDLYRFMLEEAQEQPQMAAAAAAATTSQLKYTASPTKQHLSADLASGSQQQNATEGKRLAAVVDEVVPTTTITTTTTTAEQAVKNLYTHRSLFDFYTLDQNAVQKIPYPVDFDLLSNNLNELLQKSTVFMKKLSPKKAWLSTSLHASQGKKRAGKNKQQNTLCDFFEQLSAAVMIDAQDQRRMLLNSEYSALAPRRLSADLTHTLVERAIEVNLCPESMPYNLFQTSKLSSK